MEPSNLREKNKETTICNKRTVKCDVGIAQYDNGTIKYEKKNKETTECNKKRTDAMLVLLNITMEPSNLRKKIKELLYVTTELSNVIFELHNVRM